MWDATPEITRAVTLGRNLDAQRHCDRQARHGPEESPYYKCIYLIHIRFRTFFEIIGRYPGAAIGSLRGFVANQLNFPGNTIFRERPISSLESPNLITEAPGSDIDTWKLFADTRKLIVASLSLSIEAPNLSIDTQSLIVEVRNLSVETPSINDESSTLTVEFQNLTVAFQSLNRHSVPHPSELSGFFFAFAFLKRSPSWSATGFRPGVVLAAVLT